MNTKFQQLVKFFQRLPGVGPRQAARFVVSLLDQPEENLVELGTAINNLKKEVRFCGNCFNISDNSRCHICHDPKRDQAKLMVVEKVTDLESIEKTGLYRGLYHVLGGAINPLDKITPDNLRIKELENRLDKILRDIEARPIRGNLPKADADHAFQADRISSGIELILATNPNTPGETTALYLRELFAKKKGVILTRLGRGLASGSHLEYADETTLKYALESRK